MSQEHNILPDFSALKPKGSDGAILTDLREEHEIRKKVEKQLADSGFLEKIGITPEEAFPNKQDS